MRVLNRHQAFKAHTPAKTADHSRPRTACRAQSKPELSRSSILRQGISGTACTLAFQFAPLHNAPYSEAAPLEAGAQVQPGTVAMRTLPGSELAIGFYPKFDYDSNGGGGIAKASRGRDNRILLSFDPSSVLIPPVESDSTKFLGAPLIPFVKIAIKPTKLEGFIDQASGEVQLQFDAEFNFTAPLYKAAPLYVETLLTTETVSSQHHNGQGKRLTNDGFATLTGTAQIAKTGDKVMDSFLVLPTDVIAVMKAQFQFPESL